MVFRILLICFRCQDEGKTVWNSDTTYVITSIDLLHSEYLYMEKSLSKFSIRTSRRFVVLYMVLYGKYRCAVSKLWALKRDTAAANPTCISIILRQYYIT